MIFLAAQIAYTGISNLAGPSSRTASQNDRMTATASGTTILRKREKLWKMQWRYWNAYIVN
jgi:hypothetical protein